MTDAYVPVGTVGVSARDLKCSGSREFELERCDHARGDRLRVQRRAGNGRLDQRLRVLEGERRIDGRAREACLDCGEPLLQRGRCTATTSFTFVPGSAMRARAIAVAAYPVATLVGSRSRVLPSTTTARSLPKASCTSATASATGSPPTRTPATRTPFGTIPPRGGGAVCRRRGGRRSRRRGVSRRHDGGRRGGRCRDVGNHGPREHTGDREAEHEEDDCVQALHGRSSVASAVSRIVGDHAVYTQGGQGGGLRLGR